MKKIYSLIFVFVVITAGCRERLEYEKLVDETQVKTAFYYSQYANYMLPTSPPKGTLPLEDIEAYFFANSKDVVRLAPYLDHYHSYFRWTIASTMGRFGEQECIAHLKKRLEVEKDDYVRSILAGSIEDIRKRMRD